MEWVIFLVIALPLLGVLVFFWLDQAFVRINPGELGLVLVAGRPTERSLDPGRHFVPVLRRIIIQKYPSLDLTFRAVADDANSPTDTALEQTRPAPRVTLGDRTAVELCYSLRFRLERAQLPLIHDHFGPDGIYTAVRDRSTRTIRAAL